MTKPLTFALCFAIFHSTSVTASDYCEGIRANGADSAYCKSGKYADNSALLKDAVEINSGWEEEVFNIDTLQIVLERRRDRTKECSSGAVTRFHLTGVISPDSTFAMGELLRRNPPCKRPDEEVLVPPIVIMNSRGGLLADGYALGRELRRLNATVKIANGSQCASSCAVAFLGGTRRIVASEASVMFHAPYFAGRNERGMRDVNCDVGNQSLEALNAYYREMTSHEVGDRLFERTMWYCSAEDGWVVKGASAAELYGIATEK